MSLMIFVNIHRLIYMKRIFLLMVLLAVGMTAMAQNAGQVPTVQGSEEQYYIYNFIYISGDIKNEGLKADIDDGTSIERVKDAEGKTIKFRSPAAVLMHFVALGWEWVGNGDTLYSGGIQPGRTGLSGSAALRKRCLRRRRQGGRDKEFHR